jgi:hypothetical protein
VGLWRDSSGRLTFDMPGVTVTEYPAVCRHLAEALELIPVGEFVIGPDKIFCSFRRGEQEVSLDWDIWMEFMAVAESESAEPLVRDIAVCLGLSQWATAGKPADPGSAPARGNC